MAQTLAQIIASTQALQARIASEGITSGGKQIVAPGAYNPASNTFTSSTPSTPKPPVQQTQQPTQNNQAAIDEMKKKAEDLQRQLAQAQSMGYAGNQQIQTFSTGAIKPNQSTGNETFDKMITAMNNMFEQNLAAGKTVNKKIDPTDPKVLQQFTDMAENELDPYYKTLFKAAKQDVYSYMDQSKKDYDAKVALEAETFRRSLGKQRNEAGERGLVGSSNAYFAEQNMVSDTNRSLENLYNTQTYDTGSKLRDYTYAYGTDTGLTQPIRQLGVQSNQAGTSYERQLKNLTPEAGITGSEEFKMRAAKKVYASNALKSAVEYDKVGY